MKNSPIQNPIGKSSRRAKSIRKVVSSDQYQKEDPPVSQPHCERLFNQIKWPQVITSCKHFKHYQCRWECAQLESMDVFKLWVYTSDVSSVVDLICPSCVLEHRQHCSKKQKTFLHCSAFSVPHPPQISDPGCQSQQGSGSRNLQSRIPPLVGFYFEHRRPQIPDLPEPALLIFPSNLQYRTNWEYDSQPYHIWNTFLDFFLKRSHHTLLIWSLRCLYSPFSTSSWSSSMQPEAALLLL